MALRDMARASPEIAALTGVPRAWPWGVALAGLAPGAALVLAAWPPLDIAVPTGAWALYALAVVWAASWLMRACLAVIDPAAPGAQVAIRHYLWRTGLAWALTMAPAAVAWASLRAADPEGQGPWTSALLTLTLLGALGLAGLAALTSAHVAATGRFSPLEVWALMRGRRLATLGLVAQVVFGGVALLVALFAIPSGLLILLGAPWTLATWIGASLFHGAWLLVLAAVATGLRLQMVGALARDLSGGSGASR